MSQLRNKQEPSKHPLCFLNHVAFTIESISVELSSSCNTLLSVSDRLVGGSSNNRPLVSTLSSPHHLGHYPSYCVAVGLSDFTIKSGNNLNVRY